MKNAAPTANSLKPGKWIRSTCKMCLHSCTTRIHVTDDGIINKIEGDETNPSNNGKLCPKGNSAILRHYDPNRLKYPMKRTNPEKGPGIDPKWERISWDEAYEITAEKIGAVLKDDPRKILPSLEEFQKFNIWTWALSFGNFNCFQSAGTMCGGAYHPINGYIHSAFAGANDAKYCNYWINNGTGDGFSSHLHAAAQSHWVANARERGMHVVSVEPRLSIGSAKADEWVPIRPATDRFFAMGMSHVMINEGLCDYDFLKKDTNAPYLVGEDGYFLRDDKGDIYVWDPTDNKAKLWNDKSIGDFALEGSYEVDGKPCKPAFELYKENLAALTPEKVEELTTVPADTVRRIAREFSAAAQIKEQATITLEDGRTMPLRPAAYNYYRGAQGRKLGFQTNHAFKLVNMLVGSIDTPGGHMGVTLDDKWVDNGHVAPGESGMLLPTPHQLGPVPPFSYPPNEFHLMGYFPIGVNPPHMNLVNFKYPGKYGVEYMPEVAVIAHSNPIWSMQGNRNDWYDMMRSLKFIMVCDIIPNETTDFADIVMPSHGPLESWNMTMIEPPHTEGMCLRQPASEPLYDTKSMEDIFYELSERLGILENYNHVINATFSFDHKPELMLDPTKKYTDKEIAERRGKLWNDKDLDWYIEHGHSVTERRLDKWYRPWDGLRLHFYIEDVILNRDQLKAKMEEAQVPYRDEWEWEDYQPLPTDRLDPIHEEPEEYDMYGIFFKDIQVNFGESLSNPWIKDIVYRDPVHTGLLINAKTCEKKGLKDHDIICVESPYGKLYGRVKASQGVHPDTVGVSNSLSRVVSQHSGVPAAGGHFNGLLPIDLRHTDAVSGQPDTACAVKVTKLDDWPDELKGKHLVYDVIDGLDANGTGKH